MNKWRMVSMVAVPGCVAITAYNLSKPPHFEENKAYPYMRLRKKDFPWGKGQCDLFNMFAGKCE